jgi:hypothetical protein
MKKSTFGFASLGLALPTMFAALLMAGAVAPVQAQCTSSSCPDQIVALDPTNAYQLNPHAKVKSVLLYDRGVNTSHSTGKSALRRSLYRLAQKYGFKLQLNAVNNYLTAATLEGVDVLIFSNGDGDVLNGDATASTTAVKNFIQVQGKSMLMVHAAAAFIPCPTNGEENMSVSNCRFMARAVVRQYFHHNDDNTQATIFVDSTAIGTRPTNAFTTDPVAAIDHGIKNEETKNIFTGLVRSRAGVGCEWYNYRGNPRHQASMVQPGSSPAVVEGRVNILLALDEGSYNEVAPTMGDHPMAWTRKMGPGLSAYVNGGHSDIYIRADSVIEKFNWRLIRYLSRDFVGCTDPTKANYNPEASVLQLTATDPAEPCGTTSIQTASSKNRVPGLTVSSRSFEIATPDAGFYRVYVSDASGSTVYAKTVVGGSNKRVALTKLSKGSYYVHVTTPGKIKQTTRVSI